MLRPMLRPLLRPALIVAAGLALATLAMPTVAPGAKAAPAPKSVSRSVSLQGVTVTPSAVRGETLCRLTVTLRNAAPYDVSAFRFRVWVEGRPLPGYERRVIVETLPAGTDGTIRLPNFWSAESGRPAPTDGTLDVEVELVEARRLERSRAGAEEALVLGDAVPGLPVKNVARLAFTP